MSAADRDSVRALYAEGLATGLAAFATEPTDWDDWDSGYLQTGRRVARVADGALAGWTALAPVPDT